MWTLLFDNALPLAMFEKVHAQVATHAGSASLCEHSFWYPLAARPRLFVEHAILALKRLVPIPDVVTGVEWWVPVMSSTQGMEWHRDCDRIIYNREKRFVSPHINSIYYVRSGGGPTLVVDQVPDDHRLRRPSADLDCTAFVPAPNRYSIFPGDRLHAVAIAPGDQLRITLAINWWTRKPSAPLCIEAPYDAAELAPFTAAEEICAASSDATQASPRRLPAHELAALPHRKFCPIYDATT